ncbi:MAG TPA: hypothetical protein VKM55_24895 [Candidatus Lokiarchaeia archaeon]|nr:hypothetical protein [Candidatus Lokiarchaeia archaeon]
MKQINFRLSETEFERAEMLAKALDMSVPALLKDVSMKGINNASVETALNLYKTNKIGLKKAWLLSGLEFHEFLDLLGSRNIEPNISDEMIDEMIEAAESLRFEDIFPGKSREELRKLVIDFE